MIKAILFDLDGTLIDSTKKLHFNALNLALREESPKYVITPEEENNFDALSTKQKLKLLTEIKGLPENLHVKISERKQDITKGLLQLTNLGYFVKRKWLQKLKDKGFKLGLCTNSVPETTNIILEKMGVKEGIFDIILTNADVKNPKPNPEIYIKAQNLLGLQPLECLVVEDSLPGIKSGLDSGSHVINVKNSKSLYHSLSSVINKHLDKIDKKIEKLLINKIIGFNKGIIVECSCECGNKTKVHLHSIIKKNTSSCGCLQKETTSKTFSKHKQSYSKTYKIWDAIKQRCVNKKNKRYKDYGERGITICDRWLNFENFISDMGESPKGFTIERIENNKGYEPGNCKWATYEEQNNNTRFNKLVSAFGEIKSVAQWSRDNRCVVSKHTLRSRISNSKWEAEKAITTPSRKHKKCKI